MCREIDGRPGTRNQYRGIIVNLSYTQQLEDDRGDLFNVEIEGRSTVYGIEWAAYMSNINGDRIDLTNRLTETEKRTIDRTLADMLLDELRAPQGLVDKARAAGVD